MTDGAEPTGTRSEAADLRLIIDYLGIRPSAVECQRITGLSKSSISALLNGKRTRNSRRRAHIATVASVVEALGAARLAATGSAQRGSSSRWLQTARLATARGVRTPLDVLSDDDLAREALVELRR